MCELHSGQRYQLSGADPESYFDLRIICPRTKEEERIFAGM